MNVRTLSAIAPFALLFACEQPEVPEQTNVVRPAKVIEIKEDRQVRSVALPAIVGAADNSILTFQVNGLVETLLVSEGEEVARGTILARLDQRDFRNSVASAQAQFENAEVEFARAERLIAENAISQSIFDQRRSELQVARASLDSARKQIDDSVIIAPFDGVVADIHIETFETVSTQQPVLTLQSSGEAEAVVQVPASLVVNIEQLEPIELFLELDAAPGVRLPAVFVESASTADATTQTFEARFAFTPPEELVVLPGMTGLLQGRFSVDDKTGADVPIISIPISAVLSEAGETYVWKLQPDGLTVTRQSVRIESGIGQSVIVTDGLTDGDKIIGAGGAYLHEGSQIRVFEP